jgi:alkylation response protein AidB-like acyl-CoA dehydrogenase
VRFAFTDDQLAFRDAVRELLDRECPPAVVREAWTSPSGRALDAWAHLAEMGVLAALAPEAAGGLGLTLVDLVLVLEETGYVALPDPIVEHAAVAVPLLASRGEPIGVGTVTAGWEPDARAVWADTADLLAVGDDGRWRVVAAGDVQLEPRTSVDGARRLFAFDPRSVEGPARVDEQAFDRGVVGFAAQLLGLTRRMLDLTVGYVTERRQFGVPVGSFQAVKHQLADARLALEFARPLVYRAAWSLAEGDPDASVHASMAKLQASGAAHRTGRAALQCHGAIGYSFEYDLHLFLKRAWALAASWGDARWHRARVRRAIL